MEKYTKIGIDQMSTNRQRIKELEKTKDVADYLLCKKIESTFTKFVKTIFPDFVVVHDDRVTFKKYDKTMLNKVSSNEFNLVGSKLVLPIQINHRQAIVKKIDPTYQVKFNLNNFARRSR
jgi:hypothetical protein